MENTSIISKVAGANAGNYTAGRRITGNENLDKDAFLKLLVTELRHQDPTQPMENKEFISQMAQFSALEQMTNVNKSIQALNRSSKFGEAYSLLGKNVQAFDSVTGRKVEGTVAGIFYKNNEIRLMVNNNEIGLDDIHAVFMNYQPDPNNDKVMNTNKIKENNTQFNNTAKDINNNNDTNIAEN